MLLLFCALLIGVPSAFAAEIHFIDIGNGMACLIDSGEHEILIEGGSDFNGLVKYLETDQLVEGKIELVIALHPSGYAFGGLLGLLENGYDFDLYWDAGWTPGRSREVPSTPSGYRSFLELLDKKGVTKVHPLSDELPSAVMNDKLQWYRIDSVPEARFCLLYDRPWAEDDYRHWPCLSLLIEIEGVRLFFSGHSADPQHLSTEPYGVEARLLDLDARVPGALHADLMAVPDLGSPHASSPRLIDAVAPRIAVISGSDFQRLPRSETIDRYQKSGRPVFLTTLHYGALNDNIRCVAEAKDLDCRYQDVTRGPYPEWRGELNGKVIDELGVVQLAEHGQKSLVGADLAGIDLSGMSLSGFDLTGADLSFASLEGIDLTGAVLNGVNFSFARLDDSTLRSTVADGSTRFHAVHAPRADFSGASIAKCDFSNAILPSSNFSDADATGANFTGTDLGAANFSRTTLANARVFGASLRGARWELRPGGTPVSQDMTIAGDLSSLVSGRSQHSLVELRDAFRKSGLTEQARLMTYEIQHRVRIQDDADGNWIESKFKLLLFEWPTKWGMSPGRPMRIVALLWLLFALAYFAIARAGRRSTIRLLVTRRRRGEPTRNRMHIRRVGVDHPRGALRRARFETNTLLTAASFSLRNTLNLKFQWLDAATWVRMLQKRDFELEGTGWIRTLAGVQSLVSLYLIAMALLTYFGAPFD